MKSEWNNFYNIITIKIVDMAPDINEQMQVFYLKMINSYLIVKPFSVFLSRQSLLHLLFSVAQCSL